MRKFEDLHLGEEAFGGLSAGIVGTVIGFPLDLVKTRMQTGQAQGGILSTASHVVRSEGILALYKGIAPPLISLSIVNTFGFTSYSFFRDRYGGKDGWDVNNALAGMSGSPMLGIITTIENLLKTQMQMDNVTQKRFTSSWHCTTTLVKEHGFSVLYTGHVVNTTREAAFMGAYFFTYEGLRSILMQHLAAPTAVPVAGGLAGAFAWAFSFPLDCIRAGVQGRNLNAGIKKGAIRVFTDLMKTKGFLGLYSGVGPTIARAFLVSGSRFSAYEGALWLLRGGRDNR
uniref:Mitochondrial carrier protein n=1 Tax=Grammatophora oceanica TaxID=210454 RepID=A0A7S1UXL1_9STRA|mmetsp:Transcript_28500/g.41981  ORF Transcript_28500/g.41981 Transcript_28500/m.41981 type:complete len:285 (+) Transcript_28500:148-1002(+)|eukprot:CAMPEP_0194032690 /NCGR_PEP_ID=MMETSP0009_2-20130614/5583_1 /TAXON_ID=210454 /ORGANISM="Grammatophora oceanica, Strain CCMP 410" /LENGTH=284 /DNA_ID=CAMNT_0038673213 /DNA_START=70 /DNA_END=921 /DNA_ORIENTATION=-